MMKENIVKKHIIAIIFLIIVTSIIYHNWLNINQHHSGDAVLFYFPKVQLLKESISEYNKVPLWNPYVFAGTTEIGKPNALRFNVVLFPLLFIVPTALQALKLTYFLGIILAAITMYILVYYLTKNRLAGVISALIYIANGNILKTYQWGWLTFATPYALIPLTVLFAFLAFRSKDWLKYSIILGIIFTLQIFTGDGMIFLYSFMIFSIFLATRLISKKIKNKLTKVILIGIIAVLITLGIAVVKLLPNMEYMEQSSRGHLSWEQASGRQLYVKDLFTRLVQTKPRANTDKIGIVAFFLILFALSKKWNNRNVIFFSAVILLSLLMATGSFVMYLLWKYVPPFDSARYIDRALVMFVFAGAALAGLGFNIFYKWLDRFNLNKKIKFGIFSLATILIIVELSVLGAATIRKGGYQMRDINEMIEQNEIMQYLSKQEGIFRIHTFETRGIDWGTEFTTVPLQLENLYGYESAWDPQYLNEFLSVANQQPARFWGIMNVKYLTARNELNLNGFKFVKKFNNCTICFPEINELQKVYGPHLYENEQFLPRAFIVNNSVLVVGEKQSSKQTMYALMLNENFNPKNIVIVLGDKEKINDYSLNFLINFDAIILSKNSVDQNSNFILQSYVNKGGKILPNILENKNSVSEEELKNMFDSFKGTLTPIDDRNIITHNFDKKEIKLDEKKAGFLVLSEKYPLFNGWNVKIDNKNGKLLRANGVVTAVYLKNNDQVLFEYQPRSYRNGLILSIITIIASISYFIYHFVKKTKLPDKLSQ